MNRTKKLQYYSHEPHCKEEIFNWVLNVSLLLTTHFYFHIKHTQSLTKLCGGGN